MNSIEIDCGALKHDDQKTKEYQEETNRYLNSCFHLKSSMDKNSEVSHIIKAFKPIAGQIKNNCSPGKSLLHRYFLQISDYFTEKQVRIYAELFKYTNQVCQLQYDRQCKLPSIEQHLAERRLTAGVAVNIALIEFGCANFKFDFHDIFFLRRYVYQLNIPEDVMDNPLMKTIYLLTNDLVAL